MNRKNIFLHCILVLIIFLSYFTLIPIPQSTPITYEGYSLETQTIDKEKNLFAFEEGFFGNFLIYLNGTKPSIGVFTFKKSYNLLLIFKTKPERQYRQFKISKNGIPITDILLSSNIPKEISLTVKKNDALKIEIQNNDNLNNTFIQVKIVNKSFLITVQNFIIPLVWSIFLIYLIGKGRKYIAIAGYTLFLVIVFSDKVTFDFLSFQNILLYTIFMFAFTLIFVLFDQELRRIRSLKLATIINFSIASILYIIPFSFIIYTYNFDTNITKDILYAIFQSNSYESYEYILNYISLKYIIYLIAFTIIIIFLFYKQQNVKIKKIKRFLLIFSILASLSIISMQIELLRLPNFFMQSMLTYHNELKLFRQVQNLRASGKIEFNATKNENNETYIIILGESLNKKHMGIYGYHRDTTPNLTHMKDIDNELLIFNNIYSSHTHTVPVLSQALTESNQYKTKNYYDAVSIIEILKKANVETYWVTNQIIYGGWDNKISAIGTLSDNVLALNKYIGTQSRANIYDGEIINNIQNILGKKSNHTRVIFIHLMGNHVSYDYRYPHDKFTIYTGELNISQFGTKASKNKQINNYDNSVVYNDYVVSSILQELQKIQTITGFIYISDHADDVINNLGHNAGKFTYAMTQIPMIAWFSDQYKKTYPQKFKTFKENTDTLFCNDTLYDTLVGVINVFTDHYNSQFDLTSQKYNLDPLKALVMNGEKHYTAKDNHLYWQNTNVKYLIENNLSTLVIPTQVNTIGKFKDIAYSGLRSYAIDVILDKTLRIGHDSKFKGANLYSFLSHIDIVKSQLIYLVFKDLNPKNYLKFLKKLESINSKYKLKDKCIISYEISGDYISEFKKYGWTTAYALPSKKITQLLKENEVSKLARFSQDIIDDIKLHSLPIISFDSSLYPYVKQYLEPKISKKLIYHVKSNHALYDINYKQNLLSSKIYIDKKVKIILTPYESHFNLE